MYEIKTKDASEDFSIDKEMFDFSNYSTEAKYYDNSNNSKWKMKDETGGVVIKEYVGLKPKVHWFLVNNSECKRANSVNKNTVATIVNIMNIKMYKCIRHSMNRIQNKYNVAMDLWY